MLVVGFTGVYNLKRYSVSCLAALVPVCCDVSRLFLVIMRAPARISFLPMLSLQ